MSGFGGFGVGVGGSGGFGQQPPPQPSPSSRFGFGGGNAGFGQQQPPAPTSSFSGFGQQQQQQPQSAGQFGFGQTSTMQQQQFFGGGNPTTSSSSLPTTASFSQPTMSTSGGNTSSSLFGQPSFGGGGGFGASSTSSGIIGGGSMSVGFGGGFANSSNSSPPPPSSSSGFLGFGGSTVQSTSGFGQPQWQQPQPQPQPSTGFGSSPAAITGFGSSSIAATINNTSSGFGSSSTPSTNTNSTTGFGGFTTGHTTMPSSSFSSSTISTTTTAPPSSSSTIVFGSSSTVSATTSNTNTFAPTATGVATAGFAPAASSTTTTPAQQQLNADAAPFYGRSSLDPSAAGMMGFGGSGGGGGFNASTTSTTGFTIAGFGGGGSGFGASTSSGTGATVFGSGSATGFGAGGGTSIFGPSGGIVGNNSFATTTTPFSPHGPSPPPSSATTNDDVATPLSSSSLVGRRIPRKNLRRDDEDIHVTDDSVTSVGDAVASSSSGGGGGGGEEQLSALRAKIREKRERLQKLKMNEQTAPQTQEQSNSSEGRKSLASTSLSTTRDDSNNNNSANADLAARNALRFSTVSSDRDQTLSRLMPADLKDRGALSSAWSTPAQSSGDDEDYNKDTDDEDVNVDDADDDDDLDERNLSNAKSLVGTCLSMCPDEELIRREKEGDIQLLEVTDPGGLHPKGWTLRDTAVKRFRRSAADFKLDIPELIRPPDVLERVCGYLEEWVMERDRQGPDKRWVQQPSDTPPPLDVYQFIWDRTRMVRKDFILQNYIGTGGKCDARAVRCHERIARWHAMCEHQLSHIPEFVAHQSQQNIAELGQTMKTLNNYYDDASGRSLIEVANDEGTIDSHSVDGAQGCVSDIVMGISPIDFDGSTLNNSTASQDISVRIIGGNGINSPTLGTAEPEMRGLYILLTLNNEGGMEVLKYSGRLCSQKPNVFYSKPVQLALSIFQAKKEQNYAKFFSLMRSPSTPYLFACIMFKYVESVRKEALIIMSKTYGAKHKETGQPFYDSYPLENLVRLLCYEDEDEAKTACQHYGITVEGDQVLWRHGRFAEPRDPEKGHIIPLKPRKMIRTIESKLNGATRLSVCRGGVSGEGATLSINSFGSLDTVAQFNRKNAQEAAEQARAEAMKVHLEMEAKARAEKERIEKEKMKKEKLAAENRAKAEAAKRIELERLEQERIQRERIMAEQRRKELEARRLAEEKAAAEKAERERQEKERQEREMARKRAEEEARERERQRLIAEAREEEARRLAEIQAAKERAEKERREREEMHRLAELRRKAEEERIRKAQEEEARRKEMAWREKIDKARKLLVWRLWRMQMQKHESHQQSRICLESLDPTTTYYPTPITSIAPKPIASWHDTNNSVPEIDLDSQMYRLATAPGEPINLARMLAECVPTFASLNSAFYSVLLSSSNVNLFKLAVIIPKRVGGIENLYDSMQMWVHSRFRPGVISNHTFTRRSIHFETRAVAVIGNEDSARITDCNAALILLPSDEDSTNQIEYPGAIDEVLARNVPRIVLVLGNEQYRGGNSYTESILDHIAGPPNDREVVVTPKICHLDNALEQCCEAVVDSYINSLSDDYPSMVRVSLANFGFLCLQRLFQNMDAEGVFRSTYLLDSFFCLVKETLAMLATEVSDAINEINRTKQNWPPLEFYDEQTDSITSFFDGQYDLPFDWHSPFSDLDLKVQLFESFEELVTKESFVKTVERLGSVLSPTLEKQLLTMIDNDDIARCFVAVVSIIVNGELRAETREETILYLPAKKISSIIERVAIFEAPTMPEPMLPDIPDYLFGDASYSSNDEEENDRENQYPAQTIERNDNKRKPQESRDTAIPVSERIKRFRSKEPPPKETAEQKRSKEFTSYLEALLSSGET